MYNITFKGRVIGTTRDTETFPKRVQALQQDPHYGGETTDYVLTVLDQAEINSTSRPFRMLVRITKAWGARLTDTTLADGSTRRTLRVNLSGRLMPRNPEPDAKPRFMDFVIWQHPLTNDRPEHHAQMFQRALGLKPGSQVVISGSRTVRDRVINDRTYSNDRVLISSITDPEVVAATEQLATANAQRSVPALQAAEA